MDGATHPKDFNGGFADLSERRRSWRYQRLAEASLGYYSIGDASATLLQHNGGVAHRVEVSRSRRRFVLKIAQPAGNGERASPECLQSGLAWLGALARETDLVVQEPVANRNRELLTALRFEDLREPFYNVFCRALALGRPFLL